MFAAILLFDFIYLFCSLVKLILEMMLVVLKFELGIEIYDYFPIIFVLITFFIKPINLDFAKLP